MTQALVFIYFFYGLAFFAMGLAMLLETGRSPALAEGRSLRFLAAFGVLHGTHEWLEFYLLQAQSEGIQATPWSAWLRLGLLTLSFVALFLYAYFALRLASPKYQGHRLVHFDRLAVYEVVILLVVVATYRERPVQWLTLLDALARYMMAIPSAALAGLALWTQSRQFRREARSALVIPVSLAALSFSIYAAAQIFVRSIVAFPALYINQEIFLATTGFPIQFVRALAAIAITIGLIRATQMIERERQEQLASAHLGRMEALEERDALRRDLLQHIVRSQEDERARVARELHDEIAQYLSAFSLELAALRGTLRRADTSQKVDHLQGLARNMSQSLYRLVRDLRPSNLDDLGLVPALGSLAAQDCRDKGLIVDFEVNGSPERLSPVVETVLFRVAQEALNNVCRHAGVKDVRMELDYEADHITIRVADKGCGFDPSEQFRPPRGWGLAGMRERVESLSGQLNLQAEPGRGTTIEVIIPLTDRSGKELTYGTNHITAGR
jgi:signal transduction histidine kinase